MISLMCRFSCIALVMFVCCSGLLQAAIPMETEDEFTCTVSSGQDQYLCNDQLNNLRNKFIELIEKRDNDELKELLKELSESRSATWVSRFLNWQSDDFYYLIHHAVFEDDEWKIQTLLEYGANPNVASSEGEAALHIAARSGNWWAIFSLLRSGASARYVSAEGFTAADYAQHAEHNQLASYLRLIMLDEEQIELIDFLYDQIVAPEPSQHVISRLQSIYHQTAVTLQNIMDHNVLSIDNFPEKNRLVCYQNFCHMADLVCFNSNRIAFMLAK